MYFSKPKPIILFFLVCIGFVDRNVAQKTVLYIGGLYQSVGVAGVNREMEFGSKYALDFVNANPHILPDYELVMVENFTSVSHTLMAGDGLAILHDFIYKKPTLLLLVVSSNSMVAQPVCEVASQYNLVQVSGSASSPGLSDQKRYPLFFRLYPSDTTLVPPWEALLRHFKWKKVAILYENAEIFSLLMKELVSLLEKHGGYDVLSVEHIRSGFEPTVQIQSLKNHDARIIIVLAYEDMTKHIICQAYRSNLYGQKYVWMLIGWLNDKWYLGRSSENDVTCTDAEMTDALEGYLGVKVSSYTQDFGHVDFQGVTPDQSDLDFYARMQSTYYYAGFGYDTIISTAIALNNSELLLSHLDPPRNLVDFTYQDVEMTNVLKESLQSLNLHGVTGRIEFTAAGDRISEMVIEQLQGDDMVQVGIYDSGSDAIRWSHNNRIRWRGKLPPKDGVEEIRVVVIPLFAARIVMYTLACIGIVFSLVCLALNIKYRNMKVIKISSPFLNNFILIGCILLYILIFLYGVDTSDVSPMLFTVQCHGRPLLLSVGLSLALGALFMKTYRVYAIFKIAMEKFGAIRVGDSRLILGVVVMVIVDIVIAVTWVAIDTMSSTDSVLQSQAITDENGHDFLYIYQSRQCYSIYNQYWTISLFVYKAILLFFGVFLAWAIRSVQVTVLNESRQIALSVYVVALVCVITPLAQYFLANQPTVVYIITGTGIFLANTMVLCLTLVPKVVALRKNPHDVNTSTVKSSRRSNVRSGRRGRSWKSDTVDKTTMDSLKETLISKLKEMDLLKKSYNRFRLELIDLKKE